MEMDSVDHKVLDAVAKVLDPLLMGEGFELVHIEYRGEGRGKVLRIFMDKAGGITIDDCAKISRELSSLLDVHDVVPGAYTLEVSSAGLDRPLSKPRDFERFAGKKVKIKTRNQIGARKVFTGRLIGFIDNTVTVEVDKVNYSIPYGEIEKANLELDF
ncbi:MAG: ribosome maturation factor RimP [Deltaproteobacteria bacterium]